MLRQFLLLPVVKMKGSEQPADHLLRLLRAVKSRSQAGKKLR